MNVAILYGVIHLLMGVGSVLFIVHRLVTHEKYVMAQSLPIVRTSMRRASAMQLTLFLFIAATTIPIGMAYLCLAVR